MALFFTGPKHAGENLAQLLKQRASGLSPPIQMCDAASRNISKAFATLLANCLAHAGVTSWTWSRASRRSAAM